jgi:hypothetical protein
MQETVEKRDKKTERGVRIELQKLINKHTRYPIGNMYSKEFNERYFLNELFKKFEITPKNEK